MLRGSEIEIAIVIMSTRPYYMTTLSEEFFRYLFEENMAASCQRIVVRITNDSEQGTWHIRSQKVDVKKTLEMYGFNKKKIKANLSK